MYDYLFSWPYEMRRLFRPGKPVRHQQTCPMCKRTLVNTYRHNGEWKCKQCWDKSLDECKQVSR